jgi:hypothetical protein
MVKGARRCNLVPSMYLPTSARYRRSLKGRDIIPQLESQSVSFDVVEGTAVARPREEKKFFRRLDGRGANARLHSGREAGAVADWPDPHEIHEEAGRLKLRFH